jgi:pimeloyl-[acyl-carrier protein] methyl ester esterase
MRSLRSGKGRVELKMHFVLVHGWGFHAGIWADVVEHLGPADVTLVDLGFVSRGPEGSVEWPEDAIAVGHSLGALWLLKHGRGRFKALVSIQGFDRFCPYVPPTRVAALKRGIKRDAPATMESFWGSCGAPGFAPPEALNVERLDEGLDWLMHWNAQDAKKKLDCPMLALGSRDDPIVPPAMTEAIWAEAGIVWSLDGGHVLPLRHPRWCARHVREFADTLQT